MTSPTSSSSSLSTSVAANLAAVRASIVQHGRSLESVTIVAVSKNHDVDVVRAGYEAGLRVFGENYVHELVAKADATRDLADLQWQFLGALQSRKIDTVCQWADEVLSVSREKEVAALALQRLQVFLKAMVHLPLQQLRLVQIMLHPVRQQRLRLRRPLADQPAHWRQFLPTQPNLQPYPQRLLQVQ